MMFEVSDSRLSALHTALDQLSAPDETHITLPFFTDQEIAEMVAGTAHLSFRPAKAVVGNDVHQDMEVCFPAPRIGAFDACANLLEEGVNAWSGRANFIPLPLHLNDFAVQKYAAGSQGIGIHRDGLRYKYLVFIITLKGQSRLFSTDKRQGGERLAIDDRPGRLVMIKAPEFADFDASQRLLHGVDTIRKGRLSIGFRHEVQPSA